MLVVNNSLTSLNNNHTYSQTTFCVTLGKSGTTQNKKWSCYARLGMHAYQMALWAKQFQKNQRMPTHLVSVIFILNLMRDRLHEKLSDKERNNEHGLVALLRYPALSVMPCVRRFTTCSVLVMQSRLGTILYYD